MFYYAASRMRRHPPIRNTLVKNSAIGSTFIVAGTALGAGMLAMPVATAGIGFWTALAMLFGLWLVMSYTALLLDEVYEYNYADTGLGS